MAPKIQSIDDTTLWQQWKTGPDTRAGALLCDRYAALLLRFFSHKVRSDLDAEDLTQKTFLELVRSTATPITVKGYIFGIARFTLIRYIQRAQKTPGPLELDSQALAELDPGPGLTTMVSQNAQRVRLVTALRRLPVDTQILLELHYWEELPGPEIAHVLQIPEGTVRSRLAHAKRRLNELLTDDTTGTGEAAMQRLRPI